MIRLCSALEDERLKGISPGLRNDIATLLAAMGRVDAPVLEESRELAAERAGELLDPP